MGQTNNQISPNASGQRTWFYVAGQQREGPIPDGVLRRHIASGSLPMTTMVWTAGMPQWQPIGTIAELAGLYSNRAGFPPPVPPAMAGIAPGGFAGAIDYAAPPPLVKDLGEDAGIRLLLPVGRSGWAIASGYLGLLSVIPVFGIFALITGILAIKHIQRDRKLHGLGRAIFGIIMGGIFTAIYAVAFACVYWEHLHS